MNEIDGPLLVVCLKLDRTNPPPMPFLVTDCSGECHEKVIVSLDTAKVVGQKEYICSDCCNKLEVE